MNPETNELCTVVHACGYQVGRAKPGYLTSHAPTFGGPTWTPCTYRYLWPRGRHANPEQMVAMLHLMGVCFEIVKWANPQTPVYRLTF